MTVLTARSRPPKVAISLLLLWALALTSTLLTIGSVMSPLGTACATNQASCVNEARLLTGDALGPVQVLSANSYTADQTSEVQTIPNWATDIDVYITSTSKITGSVAFVSYHGSGAPSESMIQASEVPVTATAATGAGGSSNLYTRLTARGRTYKITADVATPSAAAIYTTTIYVVYR